MLQLLVICVVSTIVTFAVTAYAVTLTVKLMEKKKEERKHERINDISLFWSRVECGSILDRRKGIIN